MSLINEALRRAQAEQAQRAAGVKHVQLPSVPVPQALPVRKDSPFVAAVVAAMVVALGVAGITTFKVYYATPDEASGAPAARGGASAKPAAPARQLAVLPDAPDQPATTLITTEDVKPVPTGKGSPKAKASSASRSLAQVEASHATVKRLEQPSQGKSDSPKGADESYVLNGIMHGATGDAALINGRLYQRGQHVGRAVVTNISDQSVDLELDGRVVTLGM